MERIDPDPATRCGEGLAAPIPTHRFSSPIVPATEPSNGDGTQPLLFALMARADCHIMPTLVERPDDNLCEAFAKMREAAASLKIGKQPLDSILWTRVAAYWNGEMAASLAESARSDAQAYLLLAPTAISRRALYFRRASPIIVTQSISGPLAGEGPFLALLRCRIDATGRMQASSGHVQAIASPARFFPILSDHERDVLQVLFALQRNLDRYGIDLSISRPLIPENGGFVDQMIISVLFQDGSNCRLCVNMSDGQQSMRSQSGSVPSFRMHGASLRDGSFVRWLRENLLNQKC